MNQPEHDELGTQLTRTLTERADVMAGSSFGLTEVRGRARSIRRRRTATAVASVAAAVTVIIPTVSLATHTNGRAEPGPAVTQTPSATQTATDEGHQPPPGVFDVSDLPTGVAPGIDFVEGSVLHQADGSTVDIDTQRPVTSFAVLKDGSWVWQTADDQGNSYIEVQDADGSYQAPVPSTGGLSVSGSHDAAAWVDRDGQVMVWTAGATEPRPLGEPITSGSDLRISAFGSEDCQQGYCSVFVNVRGGDAPGQPWEVADYATRPFLDGHMLTVADEAGGVFIGYTKLTDFGSCSILWGGGEFQGFDTCQHTLASLSPDVGSVLAKPAYYDGLGPTAIAMFGLHGHPLFDRKSDEKHQAFYTTAEWEDDTHVLAPVFQDGMWSLVRFASDGSMEYAVAPVPGEDVENPFVLSTGGVGRGE